MKTHLLLIGGALLLIAGAVFAQTDNCATHFKGPVCSEQGFYTGVVGSQIPVPTTTTTTTSTSTSTSTTTTT